MNDNQGSDSSGKQRLGFTLRDSNLTGLDDTLYTGTIFGRHFGSVFTNYVFPVPQTDTKLSFNFSHSQVNPKKYLKPLGVNGISQNYTGQIEQRVLWKDHMTLDLFSSLEFKESRTKILSGTYYRERLRILHAGASAHVEDLWGATDIEAQGSFGVNGLGAAIHADPSNGRQGVDPAFFVLTGNFSRLQRLPYGMMLNAKGNAQFPTEKLTSSEALYLGGANSVRGYPEGDYLADCGYYTNVELIVPSFFIPEGWHLPFVSQTLRSQIQLVAFWDEGYGRLRGPSDSEAANRFLMGAGGGLRIHLFRNIYARTEWACGIGDFPLTDSNRYQFHFRIQAEI